MKGNANSGFSLLEIVVALAILSLGLAVSLQIFSGGLKNIHRIDMAHRAMMHAGNVMNEVLSDESIRQPAQLSGQLDDDFSYTAAVDYWEEPAERLSIDVAAPEIYLLSIQVDIHFTQDPRGKLYRTVSLKAVSPEGPYQQPSAADAIRQLFGGAAQ